MIKKVILLLLVAISWDAAYSQNKIGNKVFIEDFTVFKDIMIGVSPKLNLVDKNRMNIIF